MSIRSPSERRLHLELMEMAETPVPELRVDFDAISRNINEWIVEVDGTQGSLYEGQKFHLMFKFNQSYPFDSPSVTFIGNQIPEHKHIYSNGHICLSILYDDWSPALSVQSVCLSILSMLSSSKNKERPDNDLSYTQRCSEDPKLTKCYHDDTV